MKARSCISCRTASYKPFENSALPHLASLGIRQVEIPLPSPDNIDRVAAELNRHGVTAASLQGQCDLRQADVAAQVAGQMSACRTLGTGYLFVSVKAEDAPLPTVYERLRQVGDEVARHGVTLIMETHPDLVTNADVALQTMEAVAHPNVRINFDTANVYFYNHEVDAVSELRRILPYVAALHLKDTDGGFRHWHFPALGRGVVDFRGIFAVLDEAGFSGPCTLEIEGLEGEAKTERLVCERVAESVGFLRGLGRI